MKNKLVAIVGMCGSGKSDATEWFVELGWDRVYFGGVTMDELKKNVVYQLGLCAEEAGDLEKAYQYYKDIYSSDVGFGDLSERMLAVSQALKAKG